MISISEVIKGLYRFRESTQGWVVSIEGPKELLEAASKVRDSKKVSNFDCFSPFPIHGMEEAMGIGRSWLPLFTLVFGLVGCFSALGFMFYVDVIAWPMNIGGKPHFAWPAYVPIIFEVTVLLGGLASAGGVVFLGRLGNSNRKPPLAGVTSDRFAIWIEDMLTEQDVKSILGNLAKTIEPVKSNVK